MTTNETEFKAIAAEELYLACVLDDEGREIPITREMIERACKSLDENFPIHRGKFFN